MDSECVCVYVCTFTNKCTCIYMYMHIHDCTITNTWKYIQGERGEGEEEGMIVREMKRGKEREGKNG